MEQYVVFKSCKQIFALPVEIVKRVIETENFIALPEVPDYVLGVYEYQEQMLPIVDLGKRLYGELSPLTQDSKVVLARRQKQTMGIFVEQIVGIMSLSETDHEKDLALFSLKRAYINQFLKMGDEIVIELDLDYLFDRSQEEEIASFVDSVTGNSKEEENADDTTQH